MVVVEKKGARAINCKSDHTCSALCFSFFFFFCASFVPSPSVIKKTNKTKPILSVNYKSPPYISALIWRVMNCMASQSCFKKHCRFLGSLL